MNLLTYLAFVFGVALTLIGLYIFNYIAKDKDRNKKFKEYKFLLRFWLIGKYYCANSTDPKLLQLYKILNKIFWGAVSVGLCLVVAQIVELIVWII